MSAIHYGNLVIADVRHEDAVAVIKAGLQASIMGSRLHHLDTGSGKSFDLLLGPGIPIAIESDER